MRFPDPYLLRKDSAESDIRAVYGQRIRPSGDPEDRFAQFKTELFVLADGVSVVPRSGEAAQTACDTAVWAYKHIRQHKYYWQDKKSFMKRIFRTTNMTMWQKRKEPGFEKGAVTTLLVLMIGPKNAWVGSAGDSQCWIYKNGTLKKITRDKHEFAALPKKALGLTRLGLVPDFYSIPFAAGDLLCITSDGVSDYLTVTDLTMGLAAAAGGSGDMSQATEALFDAARTNGSEGDMTCAILKRTA